MKKNTLIILFLSSIFLLSCSKSIGKIELFPVKSGDKWGYVDRVGKIVINPQFEEASAFRDGLALVKTTGEKGGFGYIDTSGKMIISPTFKSASVFNDGLAWVVSENSAPTAINDKGEVKFSLEKAQVVNIFREGLAAFSVADTLNGESWGFVDEDGKVIIPNQFNSVGDFNEKKCAVENKENKWGYIDNDGKILINPQFESASKFKNGTAIVQLDNKSGVIDESGKYIINPQYSNIENDKDMFLFELDGKWGWCDKEGKILINPQFEEAFPFGDSDLAPVKSGGKIGFIDKKGVFIINPQFDWATSFNDDLSIIQASSKIGFIDEKGKYIVNPQFDGIATDLLKFLKNESSFDSVETDFFDVKSIINKVNFDLPEGVNLNDNISNILKKLNFSPEGLNGYSSENTIINSKKITEDIYYNFSLIGNLFTLDEYGYVLGFNPDAKVDGVLYTFKLTSKAFGKGESIKKEFVNSLSKYSKIKSGFYGSNFVEVYKDSKKYVILEGNENLIQIKILNINTDISAYISSIKGEIAGGNYIDQEAENYDNMEAQYQMQQERIYETDTINY